MDSFSGYNQTKLDPLYFEQTAFRTPMENCTTLSCHFGVKNAGVSYRRAMTGIFYDKLHDCLEDYVDAIVLSPRSL